VFYPYANWRPNVVSNVYYGALSPIGVICHYTAAGEPGVSAADWRARGTGAHFLVHLDGSVDQFVDTNDFVWHARGASRYYLGIEHVANPPGPGASPPYAYLNETQLSASACLVGWLSLEFGFPLQRSKGYRFTPGIKAHNDGMQAGGNWNAAKHYDGVWQADVPWLSAAARTALDYSPWDFDTYVYSAEWYAEWFRENGGPQGDASEWWYGGYSYEDDPYYSTY
jgi:hypothetical protein